jgi:hypothetical protein
MSQMGQNPPPNFVTGSAGPASIADAKGHATERRRRCRVEVMEWTEDDGADYIFDLAGNPALDALVPS